MRTISTEILIDAPGHIVWSHLMNFERYPEWNSFIISISGQAKIGSVLSVVIHPPEGKPLKLKPVCTQLIAGREFQWKGRLFLKNIFDGEHKFILVPQEDGKTLFIQTENFTGILVPLVWSFMHDKTRKGFYKMNYQLKKRAESSSWQTS